MLKQKKKRKSDGYSITYYRRDLRFHLVIRARTCDLLQNRNEYLFLCFAHRAAESRLQLPRKAGRWWPTFKKDTQTEPIQSSLGALASALHNTALSAIYIHPTSQPAAYGSVRLSPWKPGLPRSGEITRRRGATWTTNKKINKREDNNKEIRGSRARPQ